MDHNHIEALMISALLIQDDIGDVAALKHLPSQLSELMEIIGRFKFLQPNSIGSSPGPTNSALYFLKYNNNIWTYIAKSGFLLGFVLFI